MSHRPLRLSRRQALGLAAGGALGAAGLRVATLHIGGTPGSSAVAATQGPGSGVGDWATPLGDPRARAAHLLRRAGFTYTAAELDHAAQMSYGDLVDSIVNQKPEDMTPPAGAQLESYQAVTTAWYQHMATTTAQFPEHMTAFAHGLFTSDYRKVAGRPFVWYQNVTYRHNVLTDLRTMLKAVTHDPLMMTYLDLVTSSAKSPNENYSRELMELYTMGPGNYSEQDVREGARALSGLVVAYVDASGKQVQPPRRQPSGQQTAAQYYAALATFFASGVTPIGVLDARRHDAGTKSYLGRTGNLGPDDVIDAILAKDATATFIARKAIEYFAVPQADDAFVSRVASSFRTSGYDMRGLMRTIFLDDAFTAPSNYRSLVRSPLEYMVATMRVLGRPTLAKTAVTAGQQMNQQLYDPPTVGGWPVNAGWLDSSSWLGRINFAQTVVGTAGPLPAVADALSLHLDGVVGPDLARVIDSSHTDADRWYALLASPEFHLK